MWRTRLRKFKATLADEVDEIDEIVVKAEEGATPIEIAWRWRICWGM